METELCEMARLIVHRGDVARFAVVRLPVDDDGLHASIGETEDEDPLVGMTCLAAPLDLAGIGLVTAGPKDERLVALATRDGATAAALRRGKTLSVRALPKNAV